MLITVVTGFHADVNNTIATSRLRYNHFDMRRVRWNAVIADFVGVNDTIPALGEDAAFETVIGIVIVAIVTLSELNDTVATERVQSFRHRSLSWRLPSSQIS